MDPGLPGQAKCPGRPGRPDWPSATLAVRLRPIQRAGGGRVLSAFGRFNELAGGAVQSADSTSGGGECCPPSADSTSGGGVLSALSKFKWSNQQILKSGDPILGRGGGVVRTHRPPPPAYAHVICYGVDATCLVQCSSATLVLTCTSLLFLVHL